MNGFSPPRRMLDAIAADVSGPIYVMTGTPQNVQDENYAYMIDWPWMTVIARFGKEAKDFATRCARITHEAFMNAAEHGNQNQLKRRIRMILWPGEHGVLFGIRDEGSYFRSQEVRRQYEARIPIASTRRGVVNKGRGLPIIYGADGIAIAPSHRTLYLTMMRAR